MAALLELIFEWAWGAHNRPIISTVFRDPLTAAGGTVILGFVLYQVYYAFYRPSVAFLPDDFAITRYLHRQWPGKWWLPTLAVRYTSDLGGAVLRGLADIPGVAAPLERALQLNHGLTEYAWPTNIERHDIEGRRLYHDITVERSNAVRSLLNLTGKTGDSQIKRSFTELGDIYHALGACRATLVAIAIACPVYIAVRHSSQFARHLVPCIAASIVSLIILLIAWRIILVNRRDSWRTMTAQLRNDLRMWALRNPEIFTALELAPHPSETESEGVRNRSAETITGRDTYL